MLVIKNGKIYTSADKIYENGDILIENGTILAFGENLDRKSVVYGNRG